MSVRWHKKFNLLIEFQSQSSQNFISKHIVVELTFEIDQLARFLLVFKLFICPPDVKMPTFFRGFRSWTPNRAPPWTCCRAYFTLRPPVTVPNLKGSYNSRYIKQIVLNLHKDGVHLGMNIRCNREIMIFVKLMDLFLKTCLVLKSKSINFIEVNRLVFQNKSCFEFSNKLIHLLDFMD